MSEQPAIPQGAGIEAVNANAPVAPDAAIAWIGQGVRIHTYMLAGVAAGADMDRPDIVALIHRSKGVYQVAPDTTMHALKHRLAVWAPNYAADSPGAWLFVETIGEQPPRSKVVEVDKLLRRCLHIAVGDDHKNWEDADGIPIGGLLAAALSGDYNKLEAELDAYDAQVAVGEAQMLADADAADTEG